MSSAARQLMTDTQPNMMGIGGQGAIEAVNGDEVLKNIYISYEKYPNQGIRADIHLTGEHEQAG